MICNNPVCQVRYLPQCLLGVVVQVKRLPAGCARPAGNLLGGGGAAARLPPLPGLHQLHHLGVHVPPQDLVPEKLRGRRKPVRPRRFL